MKILVTGATGFVGKALVRALLAAGHEVILLGRSKPRVRFIFQAPLPIWTWVDLESSKEPVDAVINLAGESVAGWWTHSKKGHILDSRVAAIKRITAFCLRQKEKFNLPIRLFQASGVGVYGLAGDRLYDEETPHPAPQDFLATVAVELERLTEEAVHTGIPVTLMRFGVVLDPNGGLLEQLFPFFKYGLGAVFGSGSQYLTWITRVDLVSAILFLLDHPELTGPINVVAKEPITQQEFAERYARFLNRPLYLKVPKCLISFLLGEMGRSLLLGSQRVLPHRLVAAGFEYQYPSLPYYFSTRT